MLFSILIYNKNKVSGTNILEISKICTSKNTIPAPRQEFQFSRQFCLLTSGPFSLSFQISKTSFKMQRISNHFLRRIIKLIQAPIKYFFLLYYLLTMIKSDFMQIHCFRKMSATLTAFCYSWTSFSISFSASTLHFSLLWLQCHTILRGSSLTDLGTKSSNLTDSSI